MPELSDFVIACLGGLSAGAIGAALYSNATTMIDAIVAASVIGMPFAAYNHFSREMDLRQTLFLYAGLVVGASAGYSAVKNYVSLVSTLNF